MKVWTDVQVERLQALIELGVQHRAIALELGVTHQAVAKKIRRMGLQTKSGVYGPAWTEDDLDRLLSMKRAKASYSEIGLALGRTRHAIAQKIFNLSGDGGDSVADLVEFDNDHAGHIRRVLEAQPWGFLTVNSFKPGGARYAFSEAA